MIEWLEQAGQSYHLDLVHNNGAKFILDIFSVCDIYGDIYGATTQKGSGILV